MFQAALTILQLPAKATVTALKGATSANAVNALSSAIAQASLATADQDQKIDINGVNVTIEFNEERLLTTAGISTAIALGSVYWIGEKLKIQYRYDRLVTSLENLRVAIAKGQDAKASKILNEIDVLTNPLIDPETLLPVESSDEVKDIYEALFNKPAQNGSMFNAEKFTSGLDDTIKGLNPIDDLAKITIARKAVLDQTDDVLEVMVKKAKPLAGKATSRLIGAVLWVDTVWWVATSALDLGLNYIGIDEEDQKIPILSDIPYIGALFDLSDSVGTSFVDLVVSPIIEGIISLFSAEEVVEDLMDVFWGIVTSAALNPTLTPFIIAILDFYIDDVKIEFDIPATFNFQDFGEIDYEIDLFGFRPEPLDILIVWLYLITGKIVFKAWVLPSFHLLAQNFKPSTS
tara:strand:+ start:7511 stop:8722 length:1212 start_codon:yes stop_codon:yes gene_type:complete